MPADTLPHMGRPFTKLSPERVEREREVYRQAPYNISRRAKTLGVDRSTLWYHLRGPKSGNRPHCTDGRSSSVRRARRAAFLATSS